MSLELWSRNGWLQPSEPTVADIRRLLEVADREINDAQASGLSPEGQFEHAYDAALQLCMIGLRASGYRVPKGPGVHKRAIDSLRYTLGEACSETAEYLEFCSRQRGQVVYERIGVVTKEGANELLDAARQLRSDVIGWLRVNHPKLLPPGF